MDTGDKGAPEIEKEALSFKERLKMYQQKNPHIYKLKNTPGTGISKTPGNLGKLPSGLTDATAKKLLEDAQAGDAKLLKSQYAATLKDISGHTILHLLAKAGVLGVMDHKDAITVRDKEGNTPLHVLAYWSGYGGKEPVILKLLADKDLGYDKIPNNKGQTPLHTLVEAMSDPSPELFKKLVSRKDITLNPDKAGDTPLHILMRVAGYDDDAKKLKILITNPAALTVKNKKTGKTPLAEYIEGGGGVLSTKAVMVVLLTNPKTADLPSFKVTGETIMHQVARAIAKADGAKPVKEDYSGYELYEDYGIGPQKGKDKDEDLKFQKKLDPFKAWNTIKPINQQLFRVLAESPNFFTSKSDATNETPFDILVAARLKDVVLVPGAKKYLKTKDLTKKEAIVLSDFVKKYCGTLDKNDLTAALKWLKKFGTDALRNVLGATSDWMGGNVANKPVEVLDHYHKSLVDVMELEKYKGIFRGMGHIDMNSPLGKVKVGQTFYLNSHKPAASYSTKLSVAEKFAPAGGDTCGVVVKLVSEQGAKALLAPPEFTENWIDKAIEKKQPHYRTVEFEYIIKGPKIKVVCVKRHEPLNGIKKAK